MRAICLTIATLCLPLAGCGGPQIPDEELGEIEFEVPDLRDIPRQEEATSGTTADATDGDAEPAAPVAPNNPAEPAEGPPQQESGATPPSASPPPE